MVECCLEPSDELATKDTAEHLDGQEEAAAGVDPMRMIGSQAAGGKNTVDMGMKTSAPTIPCSRKAPRSRFSILSIRFMVLLFRSYEGPSGEMARSVSSIESENG